MWRQIPKNSQSALYYWAYGAKKKWRKYKDKRQRDLVHIGLISAEEYEAERLAKQGVSEFSPAAAAQRQLAPGGSSSAQPTPQLPRPVLPSPAQTRAPAPGAPSPSFPAFRAPSSLDDPRILPLERNSSRGLAPAPTVIRTTNTTEQQQQPQRVIPKPASAAASGLMHLGLIGEEEYEKEVFGHTNTNSNGSTTTTSPTRSPVRIPTAIKPEPTPKPAINNSGGGGGSDAGVDRKLKDLVALGLLSWDEYEQQRGPTADTAAAARSDLKRKSAETERLPAIVVDDSDAGAGGGHERRIKRGRVSSFNELLVQRYDADIAATAGLRDERSDGEEPLTRSPDIGDERDSELCVNHSHVNQSWTFTATHFL